MRAEISSAQLQLQNERASPQLNQKGSSSQRSKLSPSWSRNLIKRVRKIKQEDRLQVQTEHRQAILVNTLKFVQSPRAKPISPSRKLLGAKRTPSPRRNLMLKLPVPDDPFAESNHAQTERHMKPVQLEESPEPIKKRSHASRIARHNQLLTRHRRDRNFDRNKRNGIADEEKIKVTDIAANERKIHLAKNLLERASSQKQLMKGNHEDLLSANVIEEAKLPSKHQACSQRHVLQTG